MTRNLTLEPPGGGYRVKVSRAVAFGIGDLLASGFYGHSPEDVIERLLERAIEQHVLTDAAFADRLRIARVKGKA